MSTQPRSPSTAFRTVRLSRPGTWLIIPSYGPWWIGTTDDFGTLVPVPFF